MLLQGDGQDRLVGSRFCFFGVLNEGGANDLAAFVNCRGGLLFGCFWLILFRLLRLRLLFLLLLVVGIDDHVATGHQVLPQNALKFISLTLMEHLHLLIGQLLSSDDAMHDQRLLYLFESVRQEDPLPQQDLKQLLP